MALTVYYLFASLQSQLPWTVCDPEWCDNTTDTIVNQSLSESIDVQSAPDLHSKSPVNKSLSELYWL